MNNRASTVHFIKEYALIEFGYRRPMSMKFEEFVDNLLKIEDDTLPKEMLREFSRFYLWAMLDPMVVIV